MRVTIPELDAVIYYCTDFIMTISDPLHPETMKFFEGSSVYKFPWEQVAQGLWQRYPNPER